MTLHLHADDLGLSRGINSGILVAVDHGFVTSVSVMVNGYAIEEAIAALADRPDLRVSIHLNLLEGRPIAPVADVPDLVGADGRLVSSFGRLLSAWGCGGRTARTRLAGQLRREIGAQIELGRRLLGDRLAPLRVDGHTHIHAVPFVADALLDVLPRDVAVVVRVPVEPFYGLTMSGRASLPMSGLVKHIVLRRFGRSLSHKLEERGISSAGSFIGVTHTGWMTPDVISAAIRSLPNGAASDGEVLLHPGGAAPEEAELWVGRPELWRVYRSDWRARERETACDQRVGGLIGAVRGASGIASDMQHV